MNSAQIEIQLIACLVAMACAIPGVFLVLRRMALITDAISHAILPGIVVDPSHIKATIIMNKLIS